MVISSLAGIGRAAYGVGLATMLSACIIVPRGTPTPSIVPQLPGDLHNSDIETLVLTTYIRSGLDRPIFMKARDLEWLTTIVGMESGTTVLAPIGKGYVTKMKRLGPTLCVILPDGRTFMFSHGHEKGFRTYRQDTLSARRRDAIVSALRDHPANAFDRVDGPCGISAKVNWSQDVASTVIEFLMRTPGRDKEPLSAPLARLVESKVRLTDEARVGTPRVLLFASAWWRGTTTITESPVFLNAPDVDAVIKDIISSKDEDILQLFDSFTSGLYSPVNLEVERACAVTSDGRVVWWSEEEKMWKQLIENPPYRNWKANILGFVAGTRTSDWDVTFLECVPSEIRWTTEERFAATAFLERLPAQERPPSLAEGLIARSKTLLETSDSRGTDVMLLCSPWCIGDSGVFLTPAFLRVDNVPALVKRISSMRREDIVLLLSRLVSADPRAPKFGGKFTVYVVGPDGVMIQLENDKLKGWSEPKRVLVSSKWRSDAIDAVNQKNLQNVQSDARFFAQITGWSGETQKRVVTFLETINTKDSEPAIR